MKGLIFDKDGTLFDFNATWGAWARKMLESEAEGDATRLAILSDVLGYDLKNRCFRPGSIVIAETVDVVAATMLPHLANPDKAALITRMNDATATVPQVEAAPLLALFDNLRARGLKLGIATNDAERPARVHLDRAGVIGHFDFIAGFDSGHGAKPGTGQLDAFTAAMGLTPADCAMIGDSLHDLDAGRAAGMTTIGVLTGPADRATLAPVADVVLGSIAELPAWLDHCESLKST